MAFVVSEGRLAATDRPVARAPYALTLPDGSAQDYAQIWRTQPQVRTVVSFLARNIAQLGIHHYRRVSDTDRERLTDSPVARLLARPTPLHTRYRTFDTLINDLGIYDVAYWAKVRSRDDAPGALVRLDPRRVTPEGNNPFMPSGYTVRGSKGKLTLPRDQVVCFHGYNPTDPRTGCSPIETLRRILWEEWQANAYREQLWRNGARMSGYLSRPAEAPRWSDAARARFRAEWQAQYSGAGPNVGGTPILDDGMTWTSAAVTPEQAQYLEARKLTREEVAASFHVPLPMVGILEHATFSNIKEQHKQLYQDCLGPWLVMIQEDLDLQLTPDFPDTAGTYLEFNLAAKLAGSFEEQAAQLSASVGAPWMTRNEARARQNLPQVDGGDELVTPLNVLTGGQASPVDSAPPPKRRGPRFKAAPLPEHVTRAEKMLAAFFERQGKAVVSALGAAVTDANAAHRAGRRKADPALSEVFDDQRWDGELSADLYAVNLQIAHSTAQATVDQLDLDEDDYDQDRASGWLAANAERTAGAVNGATKRRLIDLLADDDPVKAITELFLTYATARAAQLARSHATGIAGFATSEVARQSGRQATKTWRVRSTNPRPSHARMNGETVPLDERFSNGGMWPGDSNLDEDERAGCTCDIDIEFAD
ncbi:phage portal protein [Pseudonocardia acaciae]|uniref:phage portal protein n=1 Tax=Pseudonocardia acaciae TaxID=551276 RepID=UPI00048BCD35|nr:phage portal protein [Pseudonocardia acaciae]